MEAVETRVLKSSFSGIKGAKKERKLLEESSTSYLGSRCREFESPHSDQKKERLWPLFFFFARNGRFEPSNAARMSAAGEGLTEPLLDSPNLPTRIEKEWEIRISKCKAPVEPCSFPSSRERLCNLTNLPTRPLFKSDRSRNTYVRDFLYGSYTHLYMV